MRVSIFGFFVILISNFAHAQESLDSIVDGLNKRIVADNLDLKKLSKADIINWLEDYLPVGMTKEERKPIEDALKLNQLASQYSIDIDLRENIPVPDVKPQIVLNAKNFSMPLVEGQMTRMYSTFARSACVPLETCQEKYQGEIPSSGAAFPSGVDIEVAEAKATGSCLASGDCIYDILQVRIRINPQNVSNIIDYFGRGFDRAKIQEHVFALLGGSDEMWIDLKEFLQGWVSIKANTFPQEDDNDVCHGPARQFFSNRLVNGTFDRSTEPVAIVLKDFYCQIPENAEPTFGDYLYVPGRHSGRFILKDPKSQRWITFSVQSGGASAFRFWWADEDFSGRPFDHARVFNFRERFVDVWRRCR